MAKQKSALDANAIMAAREYPIRWLPQCKLVDETTSQVRPFRITSPQQLTYDHVMSHRHTMVVKYRQAKISTLISFLMLNKAMYNAGRKGLLVAESSATAKVLLERQRFALQNLAPAIKIEPELSSTEGITWPSFSSVRAITAGDGTQTPGIGNSPDLAHITEFAEFKDQDNFNQHFFPAVSKRAGSWLVVETTPGAKDSTAHRMWLTALGGGGRFKPLFLRWYLDPSNTVPVPDGFRATNEELRLLEKYEGMTMEHIVFRRISLETEFVKVGPIGFAHKYPFHEYDGWEIVGGMPSMPTDKINDLFKTATPNPTGSTIRFKPYVPGRKYLVTVDGNSYGASGDPSAIKVWDRATREEVACWDDREDPGLCARRAIELAIEYGNARLMVESNKPELIASCRALGYTELYWDDDHHPGWRATETTKGEAVAAMVDMLREEELRIRAHQTLTQLTLWDGDVSKRLTMGGKKKHHFDQITCCYMAAWYFRRFPLAPEKALVEKPSPLVVPDGRITARAMTHWRKLHDRTRNKGGVLGRR